MGNSRKFDAKINHGARFALTHTAYQQKAKALESSKWNSGVCAINAPKVTGRETYRYPASPSKTVMGNSRKFDALIKHGARFALTQIADQQKAKALESSKMEFRGLCNQRTNSYGPGNLSVPSLTVEDRNVKFTQI